MHHPSGALAPRDDRPPELPLSAGTPAVEILSRPPPPRAVRTSLGRSLRFKVFVAVFALVLGGGSLWNFTRPPEYRASAILLVEAPEGIGFGAGQRGVDAQNMAVQGRVLLAQELLQSAIGRAALAVPGVAGLDAETLRGMLSVAATPGTNLVELGAVGGDPDALAALVNAWVEAYLDQRRGQVERDVDETLSRLDEEYGRLDAERGHKRQALDDYRVRWDIDTLERDGNQALARLNALTQEIGQARADASAAEARLAALEQAIARGEPALPDADRAGLAQLESEAAQLRARLGELGKRYTPMYLEHEPSLRELPVQLQALESQIAKRRADGAATLRSELRRELERARRQVQRQEQQLAVARSEASRFTARYARYESLKEDLKQVDDLHRQLEARILEVKARAPQRYAQVEVVESAFAPRRPFAPPYWRDFGLVLGVAGLAALLAVGLVELLTRRTPHEDELGPVTGVRVSVPGAGLGPGLGPALDARGLRLGLGAPGARGAAALVEADGSAPLLGGREPVGALGLTPPADRELVPGEVAALLDLADPATAQLIGLLLTGLTLAECSGLDAGGFDLAAGVLRAPGDGLGDGRLLPLGPGLVSRLTGRDPLPLWSAGPAPPPAAAQAGAGGGPATGREGVEALAARLGLLAHDAGLSRPEELAGPDGAAAVRHTYICWLVRQGARLTEIERLVGRLPPAVLARYARWSPPGAARPLGEIDPVYPALAAPAGTR